MVWLPVIFPWRAGQRPAEPPGKEYVIYVRKGINEIDLTNIPGTFALEWTHLPEAIFHKAADAKGGAKTRLVNPFTDDAIVHLKLIPGK